MIILSFDVEPVAKGRPRFNTKTGRTYTPAKTKKFETFIMRTAEDQYKDEPLEGPLEVIIEFFITRPKSVSIEKRPYPIVKPDLDNFIKGVLDGLNGITWYDDNQIINLTARKRYAAPGTTGGIVIDIRKV